MYTTTANIAAKLKRSLTAEESTYFTSVLDPGIDAFINRQTETTFGSGDSTDVYVSGDGSSTLIIPTMHDISAVVKINEDDTEEPVSVDDYRTYPRSSSDKRALNRVSDGVWDEGIDNYKITGELGYSAVPGDITLVATELAASSIMENNIKSERVGDWAVTYSDMQRTLSSSSQAILDSYHRLTRRT